MSFSLLRLLHCLLSKSSSVSVAAYTQIRALASAKGLRLQTLFSQYKNPICQVGQGGLGLVGFNQRAICRRSMTNCLCQKKQHFSQNDDKVDVRSCRHHRRSI